MLPIHSDGNSFYWYAHAALHAASSAGKKGPVDNLSYSKRPVALV